MMTPHGPTKSRPYRYADAMAITSTTTKIPPTIRPQLTSERTGTPGSHSGSRLFASPETTTTPQPTPNSARLNGWKMRTRATMERPMQGEFDPCRGLRAHPLLIDQRDQPRGFALSSARSCPHRPPVGIEHMNLTHVGLQMQHLSGFDARLARHHDTNVAARAGSGVNKRFSPHRLD